MSDTLVVNLFAGPGTGKSTVCAATFAQLKLAGQNVEMAHEYAKDLTWEERSKALSFQPYVMAKQIWRVHRLLGKVDAVITDSPILLGAIYQGEGYTPTFDWYLWDVFERWRTLNIFLVRDSNRPYNPAGRNQDERKARELDVQIRNMLDEGGIPYVPLVADADAAKLIASMVGEALLREPTDAMLARRLLRQAREQDKYERGKRGYA